MGLDVYIERLPNVAHIKKVEAEFAREEEALRESKRFKKSYNDWTEEDKTEFKVLKAKLVEKYRTDEYGSHKSREDLGDTKSKKYPDHMFTLGYFRSSYNSGGINNILRETIGKDLYYIFNRENCEEYEFLPNWKEVRDRAHEVLEEYKNFLNENGSVGVESVAAVSLLDAAPGGRKIGQKLIGNGKDEEAAPLLPREGAEALALYLAEKKRFDSRPKNENPNFDFTAYSNRVGNFFFGEPVKVKAFIPGLDVLGRPAVYYVSEDPETTWYINALEIVVEATENILAQENPEEFYVKWSA